MVVNLMISYRRADLVCCCAGQDGKAPVTIVLNSNDDNDERYAVTPSSLLRSLCCNQLSDRRSKFCHLPVTERIARYRRLTLRAF